MLLAESQIAGRGRLDRRWQAPPRAGLTLSVLLRPGDAVPVTRLGWLLLLTGVAVARACADVNSTATASPSPQIGLKWPGTTCWRAQETQVRSGAAHRGVSAGASSPRSPSPGVVVVGIGLNVSQDGAELPEPIDRGALWPTSLGLAGAQTDRDALAVAVLRELADWYGRWLSQRGDPRACGLWEAYRELCRTVGQRGHRQHARRRAGHGLGDGHRPGRGAGRGDPDGGRGRRRSAPARGGRRAPRPWGPPVIIHRPRARSDGSRYIHPRVRCAHVWRAERTMLTTLVTLKNRARTPRRRSAWLSPMSPSRPGEEVKLHLHPHWVKSWSADLLDRRRRRRRRGRRRSILPSTGTGQRRAGRDRRRRLILFLWLAFAPFVVVAQHALRVHHKAGHVPRRRGPAGGARHPAEQDQRRTGDPDTSGTGCLGAAR